MICVDCGKAGEANRYGNFELAAALHQSCRGCPCQHMTGPDVIIVPAFT